MAERTLNLAKSSSILSGSYCDIQKTLTLILVNRKGESARYNYYNVPENIIADFEKAESSGKFFIANIKNTYKYERVLYYNE